MMDERTLEAAAATTQRHLEEARASLQGEKEYTVLVLGSEYEKSPLVITADGTDDRMRQMRAKGINPSRDLWAVAQHKPRGGFSICGNDAGAKAALEAHLRKR